jgi:hypothetical protein
MSSSRIKKWLAPVGAAVLMFAVFAFPAPSFADQANGCDFSSTNSGPPGDCVGPLAGSTFAGGDGNLLTLPNTFGTSDWQSLNTAGLVNPGIDQPSGSGDNSFGQGTKEDDPNATVVSGSIPPQKSDLIRFYEASETVASGDTFLYLAWERTNSLGSANMDFEIDQKATAGFSGSTTGAITLNRTPGDMLITFDFTNGGGRPTLGLNRWLVSATNPTTGSGGQIPYWSGPNVCLSANKFPCWGDHVTLTGTISEGAVNNLGSVTDPINPGAPRTIGTNRFGEAAINLTDSGVFGTDTCTTFATTFLKSRASASFPAEVKDFVAPVPTQISNCGRVTIVKNTDPRGVDQDFSFTSDVTGTTAADPASAACPTGSYNLNDGDPSTNTNDCFNVPVGDYTVTEGANPGGFSFEGLTCDATTGSSGTPSGKVASIHLIADGHVTCTYVNQQQLGAIKISKTSIKGGALQGAKFTVDGTEYTTNALGEICVDNLGFGNHAVQETAAPPGYSIDDSTVHQVDVNNNATCADNPYGGEVFNATDTPLTDITATATSEAAGGTQSSISCVDSNGQDVGDSPDPDTGFADPAAVTANGLEPGTYTCTIVIDP